MPPCFCGILRFSTGWLGRLRGGIDVFVGFRAEAWGADREEDEVGRSEIADALAAERWDQYNVARADFLWRQVVDFDATGTFEDGVAFGGGLEPMPARGDAGGDARAGDGGVGIVGAV